MNNSTLPNNELPPVICPHADAKCDCSISGQKLIRSSGEGSDQASCPRITGKRKLRKIKAICVFFLLLISIGLSPVAVLSQIYSWDVSIPFALAPRGEFGAAVTPEFDRWILDGQTVYLRRAALRMGWTPSSIVTLWGEGGVASLQLFEGSRTLTGAWGPAVGGGWTILWGEPIWKGWTPFVSGRATYLQSKLSDDVYQGSSLQSRRSRFEWIEYSGIIGTARHWSWGDLQTGISVAMLSQNEFRSSRLGNSITRTQPDYSSGAQPGFALGASINLPHRLTLNLMLESSAMYQKATVAIGQWGAP